MMGLCLILLFEMCSLESLGPECLTVECDNIVDLKEGEGGGVSGGIDLA